MQRDAEGHGVAHKRLQDECSIKLQHQQELAEAGRADAVLRVQLEAGKAHTLMIEGMLQEQTGSNARVQQTTREAHTQQN